ncbi:zinc finger CCCH domain-containing protein 41-like isoform X1 [Primulina huaijiensis]|uniref:zinc finger CCCH domain-containing protein 41-like isoform X1 n=2 Tax=Primulina huaijiensis TaxID=1492673 RepID=UPI003CC76EE7
MDLKASSQDLSPSDCASDSEEKEISEGEDEDDDRNHKHRKRETGSEPLDGDFLNQVSTRPYRKRKPFDNGFPFREGDPQSGETSKNHYGASERNFSTRSEKRCTNRTPFSRAPMDFNQRIRGNQSLSAEAGPIFGRGMEPLSWAVHNSRLGMVDVTTPMVQSGPVPSGLLAGRGLANISNAHSTSWNVFGMVPGVPNGGIDGLRHLGLQGALRQSINPAINIGLPRQRCRDFEERGFCLRGDMCPMEHGVNRIVVDDVQSLSQFNLPVSLPGSQLLGTSGNGALPVISTSSSSLAKNKAFPVTSGRPGITEDGLGLNGGFVGGFVAVGSDVYDPDQPLWTNNNSEASASLLAVNGSNVGVKESFLDIDPSGQKQIESYEGYDEKPIRSACTSLSQSLSGWGKLASSKNRFGQKNKIDSTGASPRSIDREIRSEEVAIVGFEAVSQGKGMNVDDNAPQVEELSLKPHRDSISNVRKPSQKAVRTLFVNGIPLKDNRKEALLSHFQKFGEVIDIYIPMNSERAFVQFSKREEAEAALTAPDAIMGNRFIKLWWANRDNTIDHGLRGNSGLPIMSQRKIDIPGRKENLHAAGGKDDNAHPSVAQVPIYDHLKPMAAKVSKTPPQQKKSENLELLKEELRKKQEMLDQKRNEFRLQLDKLVKQSAGVKDVTISDQAFKSLEGGTPPDNAKTETTKLPDTHVIAENIRSAEHAVQHTTASKPNIVQPSSLRQIRQPALLGTPFVGNRFKLDNRPTTFRIVAPLPNGLANVATMKEHFSTYGDLSSVELEESKLQKINDNSVQSDVSALISFTTRRSAERAFLNGKCWQDHNLQFMWLASSNSGREGGSAGIPSDSSNTPSEANAHVQPDRDATSIHSQKSDASGCSEPENLMKESGEESVEKSGSAGIPSASSNMPSEANAHVQPDRDATSIHSQKSDASGCGEPANLTKESDAESAEKGEDFQPVTTLVSSFNNAS